jgi:8-oxo-dGTP pyrophosphatase MutT (NUDIX family)
MVFYMNIIRFLFIFSIIGIVFGYIGFNFGKNSARDEREKSHDEKVSREPLSTALKNGAWDNISQEIARETLPQHLDAAKIPHGDLSVSGNDIHSKRYIISQWQRVATGAVVIVLGRNQDGQLSLALGPQRGNMVPPQGYMESPLPIDDLSGIRKHGASRINGSTGEFVMADNSLEDTALREVKEELGLTIERKDLHFIGVLSSKEANPIVHTIAVQYGTLLSNTPTIKTLDQEFTNDDMINPVWVRVQDITCKNNNCYIPDNKLPIKIADIPPIQKTIRTFGNTQDIKESEPFLSFVPN